MSNQHEFAADADEIYQWESLTLKEIINLARGAELEEWPPLAPFLGLFRDLKHAIGRGELPVAPNRKPRFQSVRLLDLWLFVRDRDIRWEPIREVCERWAAGQGTSLEPLAEAEIPAGHASAEGEQHSKKEKSKYEIWYELSQKFQAEAVDTSQENIVYLISQKAPSGAKGWTTGNIIRQLNRRYSSWYDPTQAKKIWAEIKRVGQNKRA